MGTKTPLRTCFELRRAANKAVVPNMPLSLLRYHNQVARFEGKPQEVKVARDPETSSRAASTTLVKRFLFEDVAATEEGRLEVSP